MRIMTIVFLFLMDMHTERHGPPPIVDPLLTCWWANGLLNQRQFPQAFKMSQCACKVYLLMLFWLSCGYFSCQSANFCCHRYVERFRHGQPWSREERQQMASANGEEWWASHSSVPSSTPSKAEYKGIFSLTAAFICRLLNGYKLMSFVASL